MRPYIVCGYMAASLAGGAEVGLCEEFQISHQFHETKDARGRAAAVFAEEVEQRAPDIKIRIHPQLSLGLSRDEQLDALQSGKLDMAVFPLVFAVKKIPEFSLALLPGLIPNLQAARALKGSPVHDKLQAVAAAHGLRIVTWWWLRGGFAATGSEIHGASSVAGRKMLSCGLAQDMLTAAGASASDIPWGDMGLGLEMGALDGVLAPYEDIVNMRLHEHAKSGTFGGWSIFTCLSPLLMSKKTWDRLGAEQRTVFEEAAEASDYYFEISQYEAEKTALKLFRQAGAKVYMLTDQDYLSWAQLAMRTSWDQYAKSSSAAGEIIKNTMQQVLETLASDSAAGVKEKAWEGPQHRP